MLGLAGVRLGDVLGLLGVYLGVLLRGVFAGVYFEGEVLGLRVAGLVAFGVRTVLPPCCFKPVLRGLVAGVYLVAGVFEGRLVPTVLGVFAVLRIVLPFG